MRFVKLTGLGLLALGFSVVQPAFGQEQNPRPASGQNQNRGTAADPNQNRGTTADKDQKAASPAEFVRQASAAGLAEVNMGRLAEKQANSDAVKKYARQIVEDHTKANDELNKIADRKRLMPAQSMDAKHQTTADQMAKLSGADFDRHFIQHMISDHEKAIALFQAQAKGGTDPDLKAYAEKTLPKLKDHLKMAQDLNKNTKTNQGQKLNADKGGSDR